MSKVSTKTQLYCMHVQILAYATAGPFCFLVKGPPPLPIQSLGLEIADPVRKKQRLQRPTYLPTLLLGRGRQKEQQKSTGCGEVRFACGCTKQSPQPTMRTYQVVSLYEKINAYLRMLGGSSVNISLHGQCCFVSQMLRVLVYVEGQLNILCKSLFHFSWPSRRDMISNIPWGIWDMSVVVGLMMEWSIVPWRIVRLCRNLWWA